MIIGRMKSRIMLQKPTKEPDGMGGYKTTYSDVANVWAEFRKPRLQTAEMAGAIVSELIHEIAIRFRTDVRRGWRVRYNGKTFAVEHTYDYGREATILVCREVVK